MFRNLRVPLIPLSTKLFIPVYRCKIPIIANRFSSGVKVETGENKRSLLDRIKLFSNKSSTKAKLGI